MASLVETIVALRHFHRLAKVDLPPFINDFHLKTTFALDKKAFIFALTCFLGLSSSGFSGIVYEFLRGCFVLDDLASGFDLFFRYASTLLVVMFFHQYHACLLHCDY
jgi:hypothetical protein